MEWPQEQRVAIEFWLIARKGKKLETETVSVATAYFFCIIPITFVLIIAIHLILDPLFAHFMLYVPSPPFASS